MLTLGRRLALTRRSWRAARTSCCITRSRSTSTRGDELLHSTTTTPAPSFVTLWTCCRYTDAFVRSEYTVARLGGKMGSGFIFDTNTLHRAIPDGLAGRTVVVLEYHSAAKCPVRTQQHNTTTTTIATTRTPQQQVIHALSLPIPCPSGDQRLLSPSERHVSTPNDESSTAPASREVASDDGQPLSAYEPSGHYCVRWAQQPPTGDLVRLPTDTDEPARVVAMSGGAYTSLGDADGDSLVLTVRRRIAIS